MRARGTRISEHRTRNDRILLPGDVVVVEPGPHAGQWGTAWGTPTAAAGGTNRTGSVPVRSCSWDRSRRPELSVSLAHQPTDLVDHPLARTGRLVPRPPHVLV